MKAKFVGVPGEKHDSINMWGQLFALGKEIAVTHLSATIQRKLMNHPHFLTSGGEAEDIAFTEKHDGAQQLAAAQGDMDIATAEMQGKTPAPNAKEGVLVRADLEALAEAAGVKVDKRWSDDRLKAETAKAVK